MLSSNRFDVVASMYTIVLQRLHANQLTPSGPQPESLLVNRVNTSTSPCFDSPVQTCSCTANWAKLLMAVYLAVTLVVCLLVLKMNLTGDQFLHIASLTIESFQVHTLVKLVLGYSSSKVNIEEWMFPFKACWTGKQANKVSFFPGVRQQTLATNTTPFSNIQWYALCLPISCN